MGMVGWSGGGGVDMGIAGGGGGEWEDVEGRMVGGGGLDISGE